MAHRIRALKNSNSASPARDLDNNTALLSSAKKDEDASPFQNNFFSEQSSPTTSPFHQKKETALDVRETTESNVPPSTQSRKLDLNQPSRSPSSVIVEVPPTLTLLGDFDDKMAHDVQLVPSAPMGSSGSTDTTSSFDSPFGKIKPHGLGRFDGSGMSANNSNISENSPLGNHQRGGGGGSNGGGGGSTVLSFTPYVTGPVSRAHSNLNLYQNDSSNNFAATAELSESDVRPLPLTSPSFPVIDYNDNGNSQHHHQGSSSKGLAKRRISSKADNSILTMTFSSNTATSSCTSNLNTTTNNNNNNITSATSSVSVPQGNLNMVMSLNTGITMSASTFLADTLGSRGNGLTTAAGTLNQSSNSNVGGQQQQQMRVASECDGNTPAIPMHASEAGGFATFQVPPSMAPTSAMNTTVVNTNIVGNINNNNNNPASMDRDGGPMHLTGLTTSNGQLESNGNNQNSATFVTSNNISSNGSAKHMVVVSPPQQLQPITTSSHHTRVPSSVGLLTTTSPQHLSAQPRRVLSPPPQLEENSTGGGNCESLISNIPVDDDDSDGDIDGVLLSVKPNKSNASMTTVPTFGKRGGASLSGGNTPTTTMRYVEGKSPLNLHSSSPSIHNSTGTFATTNNYFHPSSMVVPKAQSLTALATNTTGISPTHINARSLGGLNAHQQQQFMVVNHQSLPTATNASQAAAVTFGGGSGGALFGPRRGSLVKRSQPNTKLAALLRSGVNIPSDEGDEPMVIEGNGEGKRILGSAEKTFYDEEAPPSRGKSPILSFDGRREPSPRPALPPALHTSNQHSANFELSLSNNNSIISHTQGLGGLAGFKPPPLQRLAATTTPMVSPSLTPHAISSAHGNPSTGNSIATTFTTQKRDSSSVSDIGTVSLTSQIRMRSPSTGGTQYSFDRTLISPQSRSSLPPLHSGSFAHPPQSILARSPPNEMATFIPMHAINSGGRQPSETMAFNNNNSFGHAPLRSNLLPPVVGIDVVELSLANEDDESNPLHQSVSDTIARDIERNAKKTSHVYNLHQHLHLRSVSPRQKSLDVSSGIQVEEEGTDRGSDDTDTPTVIVIPNTKPGKVNINTGESGSDNSEDEDDDDGSGSSGEGSESDGRRSPNTKRKKKKMSAKERHIRQLRVAEANAQWKSQMDETDDRNKNNNSNLAEDEHQPQRSPCVASFNNTFLATPCSTNTTPRTVKISRQVSYAADPKISLGRGLAPMIDPCTESIDFGVDKGPLAVAGAVGYGHSATSATHTHHGSTSSVGSEDGEAYPVDNRAASMLAERMLLVLPTSTNTSFSNPVHVLLDGVQIDGSSRLNEIDARQAQPSVTFSSTKSSNSVANNTSRTVASCLKSPTHAPKRE